MEDSELTPQDSSSDLEVRPANSPTLTGLLEGTYTCPECGAVVVRIVGNSMEFLYSHIRERSDRPNEQGYVSLVFCHTVFDQGMFMPPRAYVPPLETARPFLTVQSTAMKSHSPK